MIILLKTLGLFYIITSCIFFLKKDLIDVIKQTTTIITLFYQGLFSLLFSIFLLVINHDLSWDLTLLISLIGFLGIIKAIVMILYPDYYIKRLSTITFKSFRIRLFFSFILGLILLYAAYK